MDRLKAVLGYAWAGVAVPIVMLTFLGNEPLSRALARSTGVRVSPWYTGGEVARTVDHGNYRTHLHRPVFDGLLRERRRGFIQVDWEPITGLPEVIVEDIAPLGNGRGGFRISLDTRSGKAELLDRAPEVLGIEMVSRLRGGWAARINLRKPS